MGQLKQSLIDTPDEDQTDPRDTGNYGEPESNEPDEVELMVGHTMHDLDTSITRLEENTSQFAGEADKLRAFADRLQDAAAKVDVPF